MSNAGQAILSIGGAAVGFIVGGPAGAAWGFQLGSLAGSALFPTDLGTVSGPRLNEANIQVSTIGAPIPVLYGTFPFSGNLIWSSGIEETVTKKKQGGKGGPTQTVKTYSYATNCAVGICEGPITGINKIWADAKLIYDLSPQRADESTTDYNERILISGALLGQMQIYLGDETQLPDPTIESFEGAGNVAGFRGLAYIVFTDFQLADYGNRIPNFRFEASRCFTSSGGLGVLLKTSAEERDAPDSFLPDAELSFTVEPNWLYWIPGILVGRNPNNAGIPGFAAGYQLSSGTVTMFNSREKLWNAYQDEADQDVSWREGQRSILDLSTPNGNAYGGGSTTVVLKYFTDISFRASSDATGDFSIMWGAWDSAPSPTATVELKAGSYISVRPLYAFRGWSSVVKAATTERIGNTAQYDPDLRFDLDPNSTYLIRVALFMNATETADIKVGFQVNGGADRAAGQSTIRNPLASTLLQTTGGTREEAGVYVWENLVGLKTRGIGGRGDATNYTDPDKTGFLEATLVVETGPEGGYEFAVIWAQNNVLDLANPSLMLAGSSVVYRKLNAAVNDDVEYVVKQTTEYRDDRDAPLEPDAELFVDLEANTRYWIESVIVGTGTYDYGNVVNVAFSFDGDMEEVELLVKRTSTVGQSTWSTYQYHSSRGQDNLETPTTIGNEYDTTNQSYRGSVRYDGEFRTGATGGRLRMIWKKNSNGLGYTPPVPIHAGSFIVAHNLDIGLEQPTCQITLADIVRDVSVRCGLTEAQLDVTELTETVDGYLVAQSMSGRNAIEPLRSFGWFDCVESGGQLRWPTRGQPILVNLTTDDLAAHVTGDSRPPVVSVDRKQAVELPRRLRVHYAQTDKNAEPGEQASSRLAAGTSEVKDLEVPVRMSSQKAAQISEVLLYEQWVSRNGYRFSMDHTQMALEPADVVTIPVDGRVERVRITAIEHALPGLLQAEAVRDDDGVFVSYAAGNPPAFSVGGGNGVSTPGTAELIILDIPLLVDTDDNAGYYAVVNALGGTTWNGAGIFRSPDGGVTYTQVATVVFEGTTGTLIDALPSGPYTVVDEGNALVIESDETFESIVDASLLAGLNAAAIGAPGRWEIVQFRDAEYIESPASWRLTGLLRGRRGTEWAIGLSQAGDTFVLLDSALVRIDSDASFIGSSRPHKAVLTGVSLEASPLTDFTPAGVALEPFSPVDAAGYRDTGGDLEITWKRRGRISQELRSGVEIPLSEASESYEVDIMDAASPEVVLRTLTASAELVTYTYADQSTDFGSPIPALITVRIYQLSATVGRGYPLEATV